MQVTKSHFKISVWFTDIVNFSELNSIKIQSIFLLFWSVSLSTYVIVKEEKLKCFLFVLYPRHVGLEILWYILDMIWKKFFLLVVYSEEIKLLEVPINTFLCSLVIKCIYNYFPSRSNFCLSLKVTILSLLLFYFVNSTNWRDSYQLSRQKQCHVLRLCCEYSSNLQNGTVISILGWTTMEAHLSWNNTCYIRNWIFSVCHKELLYNNNSVYITYIIY